MALTHLIDLNQPRYVLVVGILLLIVISGQKLFLTDQYWYNIGGVLILGASAIPSFIHGDMLSYAYVMFGTLNFFLYPIYAKAELTEVHLAIIFFGLLITLTPFGFDNRIRSVYDNPNNYSAVAFSTMYFGMLLFRNRFWGQVGVVVLFGFLIFLAASRSMLGALLIFVLLYGGQRWVLHTIFRKLTVLVFIIAAFGYYSLITNDRFRLMETIQANTYSDKKDRGLSHRDELFDYSLVLIEKQPEGVGLGMSKEALKAYYGTKISPHNTYLKILVEGGWVSLFGFMILMFGFLLTSNSPLATSFLFAMMIRGFFESATPFTLSLVSAMLIIPMFLNEHSVKVGHRFIWKRPYGT